MGRQFAISVLIGLALCLSLAWPVQAQLPDLMTSPSPSASASPQDAAATLAGLQTRLAEVEASLETAPDPPLSSTLDSSDDAPPYRTSLQHMESNLRRMISLLESNALLDAQLNQVEAQNLEFTQKGLAESQPYPITLLDSLQDQLRLAEDDLVSQESALKSAVVNARVTHQQLQDRQALRRRLLDRSNTSQDSGLDLDRELENATWAVRASETASELAQAEIGNSKKAKAVATNRRDLVQRKVTLVKGQFLFTRAILERQLTELETRRDELNEKLSKARADAAFALAKLKALEEAGTSDPLKSAEFQAQSEWLTTHQRSKALLEQDLDWNLTQRDLWERRYNLSQGQGVESLSDWQDAGAGLVAQMSNARVLLTGELRQLRSQTSEILESPTESPALQQLRSRQVQAMATRQNALEESLRALDATSALADRIVREISQRRKDLSWNERARRAWAWLIDLWNIELYTIGDNSVTVGKVNVALLVLVLGLTLTGKVTRFFSRRLLVHLPITDAIKSNLERGLRYFFFLLVFLFALQVVNIPLTIFTFLGGTMAIAVGFGAQNVLNNFISGLILMVERPVRVGDLIEVEQTTGVVEEIGARSTRVRMGTGIHVVLPNSVLLENRVINWTLTDQRVRTSVSVGVAYGSDPQEVMALLLRATLMNERIEKSPEPFVLLESFADSSLTFAIHFWVSLAQPLNKRIAESDLRIAIEQLLRENEIPIPFPQRDLNIQGPVPVKLVETTTKERSPD